MRVLLAKPRGFCAGVVRAIEMVERILEDKQAPVYVRHQLVHNRRVVAELEAKGVIFVEEVEEVPPGSVLVFSAHGVSAEVEKQAHDAAYQLYDATCPLVTKVHSEVLRYSKQGLDCILIGHAGHPEVTGTLGRFDVSRGNRIMLVQDCNEAEMLQVRDATKLFWVTQTTLSVDDTVDILAVLKRRFPTILGPRSDDICYATQNRQDAVKQLALESELVLVIGSANSSNSNRLCELARLCGTRAELLDSSEQLQDDWLKGVQTVGITAGASTPESLVHELVQVLAGRGAHIEGEVGTVVETQHFALPGELRNRHRGDPQH